MKKWVVIVERGKLPPLRYALNPWNGQPFGLMHFAIYTDAVLPVTIKTPYSPFMQKSITEID